MTEKPPSTAIVEPSRKDVWKLFDAISPSYDRINRLLSGGIDLYWRRQVCRHLPKRKSLHLLDCATGTGDQLFCLLKHRPDIRSAVGIDVSSGMLEVAKKKSEKSPFFKKISWLHASALEIPYVSESFDTVTISFGIRNVNDVDTALQEIHRVLKEGGRLLVLEFSLPTSAWLKKLYLGYLRHVLPKVAGLLSKNQPAYEYLNQTIETFPYGKAFSAKMEAAGFCQVQAYPLTWGIATLYRGEKR